MESASRYSTTPQPFKSRSADQQRSLRRQKRHYPCLCVMMLALGVILVSTYITRVFIPPNIQAGAALLMNADTGRVLYSRNADQALPPASISKMMTELLVLEAVTSGKHEWNENVRISRYAAQVPGSQIGMTEGETYTLKQLFDALIIHSANDAAVAMAEYLSGTESKFVIQMNLKSREIGLSAKTYFANASGLSSGDLMDFPEAASGSDTLMTARDAATLARWLLRSYPEVTNASRLKIAPIPHQEISLHTPNLRLPRESYVYKDNNVFKTGFTRQAGYCFTSSAEHGGSRLISIVMGAEDSDKRFTDIRKLMDYGFRRQYHFWDALTAILG